jgi:hypothetical protein
VDLEREEADVADGECRQRGDLPYVSLDRVGKPEPIRQSADRSSGASTVRTAARSGVSAPPNQSK